MIDLTQELIYETDSIEHLKKMARLACELVIKEVKGKYTQLYLSPQSLFAMFAESDKAPYAFVCSLRNYKPEIGAYEGNVVMSSFDQAIEEVAKRLEAFSLEKFREIHGEGYHVGFNQYDGDVGKGFRMSLDNSTFPGLDFWICHLYYGK